MLQRDVGSLPVVTDQDSRELLGIITDRDLCCSIVALGLDPKITLIEKFVRPNPITCREDWSLETCERAMQQHQIRRIPVVDGNRRCIGIISQADLALKDDPDRVSNTVAEISRPAPRFVAG
jgi:CBS domain-containing protein